MAEATEQLHQSDLDMRLIYVFFLLIETEFACVIWICFVYMHYLHKL